MLVNFIKLKDIIVTLHRCFYFLFFPFFLFFLFLLKTLRDKLQFFKILEVLMTIFKVLLKGVFKISLYNSYTPKKSKMKKWLNCNILKLVKVFILF